LSLSRYRETVHKEEEHESPRSILTRMIALESEIHQDLNDLEQMLQ